MFTHLHVHSEYSLLDGACRIDGLVKRAKELGQNAVAITDHGVMYGAVAFYKAAKAEGIKPVIGCEVYVAPRSMRKKEYGTDNNYSHLILLCKNEKGYHNLCRLVSDAFTEGFYVKPRIDWELLHKYAEGLVCLSGCVAGEIPTKIINGDYEGAKAKAIELKELFGDDSFYLELQKHGIQSEEIALKGLLKIHEETGIPVVLTNDAHYLTKEDAYNQDVLMCIQMAKTVDDPNRMSFGASEFYLKSEEEMRTLLPDMPEAIENTGKIAELCNFDFEFGHYHLPKFKLPEGEGDSLTYLKKLCNEGFERRYGEGTPELKSQLDYELNMISNMGFVDYFLIVSDFISYAKNQGIPVGPGRGSAAGSVVSYCLEITDVDPIKYGLYFERFLNPERVSMPDIDIDFCVKRRGEVIDYVAQKYGQDHVAQIVTFGTMAAKQAVRDVGRALNVSYAECDTLAKAVPTTLNIKLDEALALSKQLRELYDSNQVYHGLIDTARALEGMPRHASTHAAGVVITERPVYEYVPLAKNDESVVCQYPMTTLEELGLLKMDFLGLRNLTVLEDAQRLVRLTKPDFDVAKEPEDDPAIFEMLTQGKTGGVFQLESTGMTSVCVGLKPQSIEDITAIIALYRPGPMDSIPRFIASKHDSGKISYKHPMLEPILNVTYGCIVYQEQVIEIFRRLAGFSLGQADMIRRAMSKKKHATIDAERKAFIYGDEARNIPGAVANGVPEDIAGSIYDEITDFADYAFNKAHAVSYAIVSYRTAFMKCHYPREYMAALLTSVFDMNGKVPEYIAECKDLGINVLPPDVNESADDFTVAGGNIRFGLAAIKGIGRGFIRRLVAEREKNGAFTSFEDFCRRMNGQDLNKRVVESLIRSGAFDSLGYKRRALLLVCSAALEGIAVESRKNISGQVGFFDDSDDAGSSSSLALSLPEIDEFSPQELMRMEKEVTGLYLSGHPMDQYHTIARRAGAVSIGAVMSDFASENGPEVFKDGQYVTIAGVVSASRTRTTRNNSLMAYITLEDATGSMELLAFQRVLDARGQYITENVALLVKGKISVRDDKDPQLMVDTLTPMSELDLESNLPMTPEEVRQQAEERNKRRTIYVRLPGQESPIMHRVELVHSMFPGKDRLVLYFEDTRKKLGADCLAHEAFIQELQELAGTDNVVVK